MVRFGVVSWSGVGNPFLLPLARSGAGRDIEGVECVDETSVMKKAIDYILLR